MKAERVIFRRWVGDNCYLHLDNIIALFPDIEASPGLCQSYEHIGQHGAASHSHVILNTVPATPKEYAPLARELRGRGYKLQIRKRR